MKTTRDNCEGHVIKLLVYYVQFVAASFAIQNQLLIDWLKQG